MKGFAELLSLRVDYCPAVEPSILGDRLGSIELGDFEVKGL